MDSERIMVEEEAANIVNEAKDKGKKVCAVGTSVMRTIESSVGAAGHLKPYDGWTNRFIFPPYEFSVANCMLANFHMPYSTLLMMASAFGGYELIKGAYELAVKEKYRFGCYGDALLIL